MANIVMKTDVIAPFLPVGISVCDIIFDFYG